MRDLRGNMTKGMKTQQEASGEDQPKDEKGLIILTKVLVGNMTPAGIKKYVNIIGHCGAEWLKHLFTVMGLEL